MRSIDEGGGRQLQTQDEMGIVIKTVVYKVRARSGKFSYDKAIP